MNEDIRPVAGGRGRTGDLLGSAPEKVFIEVMAAPDLEQAGGDSPPSEPTEGDHRPERDWRYIGFLAFCTSFAAMSALRLGAELLAELR